MRREENGVYVYAGKREFNRNDESKRTARILDILKTAYPNYGTRLRFANHFQLLVAVVLSAQSTDRQVNQVTADLFARYSTPAEIARLPLPVLEDAIRGVGLFRNKARHIKALSAMLMEKHNGRVPSTFEELMALPGVGRKSANVILALAFDLPGLGVDTHVHRVSNRLGLVEAKQTHHTEKVLKETIPPHRWKEAHQLLITHGRTICKARHPLCPDCPLTGLCPKIIT